MDNNLRDYYDRVREKLLTSCIKCGKCISECRLTPITMPKKSPDKIQGDILDFFKTGTLSAEANIKVNACMRCFGCLNIKCPIGINSMTINEAVLIELEKAQNYPKSQDIFAIHRKLSTENTTLQEYKKISTEWIKEDSKYVFFPGCNIYKQPDKLLSVFEILDCITDDYSFIPGLDYCCGSAYRSAFNPEKAQETAERFLNLVEKINPEKLILWCPTCYCQMEDQIKYFRDIPCQCITFGQFVYQNIDKLNFSHAKPRKITFHEPCKTSYMSLDTDSVRNILCSIPGTELVEMEHHGKNTLCCGCGTVSNFPEICDLISIRRLEEAQATGADTLIDVCHHCHLVLTLCQTHHQEYNFSIENYATYIAQAIGKTVRKDTVKIAAQYVHAN